MSLRVAVEPALLRWACERNQRDVEDYATQAPGLVSWLTGEAQPTVRQLEAFARATSTPVGLFFLPEPPTEELPIDDFRTKTGHRPRDPSPELLDTINDCRTRQDWYRTFARSLGAEPLAFIGSARITDSPVLVASRIRKEVDFELSARATFKTWEEALSRVVSRLEDRGVLVMRSGIVRSNTHRTLDPEEFRGFALVDPLSPVIFVNAADARAAQIFTLAHELAHLWLGRGGVSDERLDRFDGSEIEGWCDAVAAEVLVPLDVLADVTPARLDLARDAARIARRFRVSKMVVLRRLRELGRITAGQFATAFEAEVELARVAPAGSGGNFYATVPARVSPRFARAVIISALEGHTLYDEAFRMLGIRSTKTFDGLAASLGVA